MKKLILDTDIDTDCDDTGALAVLHHLANLGEVEILGVICSIPKRACALCVSAINEFYGRPEVPVGLIRVDAWERSPRFETYRQMLGRLAAEGKDLYNEVIGADWEGEHPGVSFQSAMHQYRRILARADDGSVTICAVGTLTALQQLIDSPGDGVSSLTGKQLIESKVDRLVTMALGAYPKGKDGFNWCMDRIGAAAVLNGWPGPITVSELGGDVMVGPGFIDAAPVSHPVRRAFEIWLANWGQPGGSRSSWDQLAVLRSVRGCGGIFTEQKGLDLHFDAASGEHEWSSSSDTGGNRSWLASRVPSDELAQVVEGLMIGSLAEPGGMAT